MKYNAYTCSDCRGTIFTVDLEKGVTPFTMLCRAHENCGGNMFSHFYRGPIVEYAERLKVRPHYVWRRPKTAELRTMGAIMAKHVAMGGLHLYSNEVPLP